MLAAQPFLSKAFSRSRKASRADLDDDEAVKPESRADPALDGAVKPETKTEPYGDTTAPTAAGMTKGSSSSSNDGVGSSPGTPIEIYDEDLYLDDVEAALLLSLIHI